MKKTVIIVGAGATLAESLPSQPSRSLTPPLDATFFRLCREANLQGQRTVQQYMQREFGIDPFEGDFGMEEVFNYIYTDAFSAAPSAGCLDAYWALIVMYRAAIGSTTNPLQGTSRSGIGYLLRALLDHDRDRQVALVTFNQDLLIEKAIENTKKMAKYASLPWNVLNAYEVPFTRVSGIANSPQPFSSSDATTLKVLKMHGSLNWVYRVRSGTDPKNSLRKPSGGLGCVNDAKVWPRLTHRPQGSSRARPHDVVPLIVPPIYEKSARYQSVLQPVWDAASKALREAEELIVFGYSFPDADFASKATIRQCLHGNNTLRTMHVIDVNPAIAGKIAGIVDVKSCHYYRNAATFRDIYTDEN